MKKLPAPEEQKNEKQEVTQALEKTNTFGDALDQVFKKIAVAELLLMRALPLIERRRRLKHLSATVPTHMLFSEDFSDPLALLAELEKMEIEGIVSKRIDAPYRSGTACGWVKVKTESWRRRHAGRGELFAKQRDRTSKDAASVRRPGRIK